MGTKTCPTRTQDHDKLNVNYIGYLQRDCTKFNSSVVEDSEQAFSFKLGSGEVIEGWDKGLKGVCPGDIRRIVIPSGLGYGASGSPPEIPGGATLIFKMEILKIKGGKVPARRRKPDQVAVVAMDTTENVPTKADKKTRAKAEAEAEAAEVKAKPEAEADR